MQRLVITAAFIALLHAAASAQPREIEGSIQDNGGADSLPSSLTELIDYNISNNTTDGFSAHKQNYMLPFAYSSNHDGRDGKEIKFQISIKQRLLKFYGWAFYFGYTQKSFWQAYDFRDSRPFRENNFNPEFLLRTKMWYGIRTDLGFEHESNGQTQATSRSWNRIYLTPYFENSRFIAFVKGWYRLEERKSRGAADPGGDENPGIQKYYGYGELGLTLKLPELDNIWISTVTRWNPAHMKGSVQADLSIPLPVNSTKILVQYWEGYGESLIDYNVYQRKIGIGLSFTR